DARGRATHLPLPRQVVAERPQPLVPLRADAVDPRGCVAERVGRQPVASVPARAGRLDEARLAERGEVLRDRLTRDGEARCELAEGRGLEAGERLDEVSAGRVGERGEDGAERVARHAVRAAPPAGRTRTGARARSPTRPPRRAPP